jgi:probable HAF family extracellular repeat protein
VKSDTLKYAVAFLCSAILIFLCGAAHAEIKYTVTDLGTFVPHDLNSAGHLAGYQATSGGDFHAKLYDGNSLHDLGTLGGTSSFGEGVNDNDQVTGFSYVVGSSGPYHAFVYDGTIHDIGTVGGLNSYGYRINAKGQITGTSENGNHSSSAFLWTPDIPGGTTGTMRDLGNLGGGSSDGGGINSSGWVTGSSNTGGDFHAFLFDGTQMRDLGTLPGHRDSEGRSINDAGQVVGRSYPASGSPHAFYYDGTMHDLGTLGGSYSAAYGINNHGQIVGSADGANGTAGGAFLFDSIAGMINLNTLIDSNSGWQLSTAEAINDVGQIIGRGHIGGQEHDFLLTPVPEPSTFALLAIGAIFLHPPADG